MTLNGDMNTNTDTNFNYVNNNRLNEFVTANRYSIIIYTAEQQRASSEPPPRAITADSWPSVYHSGTVSKTDQFQDNNHPQHRTLKTLIQNNFPYTLSTNSSANKNQQHIN